MYFINKLEEKHLNDFLRVTMGINDFDIRSLIAKHFIKEGIYFTLEYFTEMMCLFLRGTLQEKIDFTFTLLSPTGNPIHRDNVKTLVHNLVGLSYDLTEDEKETIDFLIAVVFNVFDKDNNMEIRLDDFRKTIEAQPYLLSTLGRCLPEVDKVKEILLLISTDNKLMFMSSLAEADWNVEDDIVLHGKLMTKK